MIDFYIKQYGRRLYGLCVTLCANPHDAEDLYQDTWLKVAENMDKYDPAKPFEPWLTRICVNHFRNAFRRMLRSPFYNGFQNSEEKDAIINSVPSPAYSDYSELHEAIQRLPEKLRMTIILFYFHDRAINVTAQVLKIPVGTVKSRLNKAKKLLKESLDHEADIPF